MRIVIDGKLYDTKDAVCVAEYSNHRNRYDVYYTSEDLYLTREGEFFLHGKGGAMSEYAEHQGGKSWGEGREIIPLTEEEVKVWIIEHFDVDEYIELLRGLYSSEECS